MLDVDLLAVHDAVGVLLDAEGLGPGWPGTWCQPVQKWEEREERGGEEKHTVACILCRRGIARC